MYIFLIVGAGEGVKRSEGPGRRAILPVLTLCNWSKLNLLLQHVDVRPNAKMTGRASSLTGTLAMDALLKHVLLSL